VAAVVNTVFCIIYYISFSIVILLQDICVSKYFSDISASNSVLTDLGF
jgi:uncharacterized membrane protein YagU involved in acid resistance